MKEYAVDFYRCPFSGGDLHLEAIETTPIDLLPQQEKKLAEYQIDPSRARTAVKEGFLVSLASKHWFPGYGRASVGEGSETTINRLFRSLLMAGAARFDTAGGDRLCRAGFSGDGSKNVRYLVLSGRPPPDGCDRLGGASRTRRARLEGVSLRGRHRRPRPSAARDYRPHG